MSELDSAFWLVGFLTTAIGILYVVFGAVLALAELIAWATSRAVKQPKNALLFAEFLEYKRKKLVDKSK